MRLAHIKVRLWMNLHLWHAWATLGTCRKGEPVFSHTSKRNSPLYRKTTTVPLVNRCSAIASNAPCSWSKHMALPEK